MPPIQDVVYRSDTLCRRYHPGQLAAERLSVGKPDRRDGGRVSQGPGRGATVEPVAALLAADRSGTTRRRPGLAGFAVTARCDGE